MLVESQTVPRATREPEPTPPPAGDRWPVLKVPLPPAWHAWLHEAANARAISMAGLVRQLIRELMIQRHTHTAPAPPVEPEGD